MQVPLEITFRGIPHSDAVETRIREKAAKLEQHFDHITSCRVAVEAEHHHQHQGNLYKVRIDLNVPNKHIVVSRDHHDKQSHGTCMLPYAMRSQQLQGNLKTMLGFKEAK